MKCRGRVCLHAACPVLVLALWQWCWLNDAVFLLNKHGKTFFEVIEPYSLGLFGLDFWVARTTSKKRTAQAAGYWDLSLVIYLASTTGWCLVNLWMLLGLQFFSDRVLLKLWHKFLSHWIVLENIFFLRDLLKKTWQLLLPSIHSYSGLQMFRVWGPVLAGVSETDILRDIFFKRRFFEHKRSSYGHPRILEAHLGMVTR